MYCVSKKRKLLVKSVYISVHKCAVSLHFCVFYVFTLQFKTSWHYKTLICSKKLMNKSKCYSYWHVLYEWGPGEDSLKISLLVIDIQIWSNLHKMWDLFNIISTFSSFPGITALAMRRTWVTVIHCSTAMVSRVRYRSFVYYFQLKFCSVLLVIS